MEQMAFRKSFIGEETAYIHLNNAGIAPLTIAAQTKVQSLTRTMSERAFHGLEELLSVLHNGRDILSKFLGAKSHELAFTQTCAVSISQAAFSLPLKPETKILSLDCEYPSNAYPWQKMAVEKKLIYLQHKTNDFDYDLDEFLEKINDEVSVVVLSWVQFQNGLVSDLKKVSTACKKVGAFLVVDGIQGVGAMPFNFKDSGIDVFCGGGHKWLGGPLGIGYLLVKEDLIPKLEPIYYGAMSFDGEQDLYDSKNKLFKDSRRFEPGSPSLLEIAALTESVKLIDSLGLGAIHNYVVEEADYLQSCLENLDLKVLRNKHADKNLKSSIVSFRFANEKNLVKCSEILQKKKISFGHRAGGIRVGIHAFNTRPELHSFLECVESSL